MKKNLIFLAVLMSLHAFAAVPVAAKPEYAFFSTQADIPLMPGMYELSDEAVVFDKAEGRVAQSVAVTRTASVESIRAFYAQTLPQLGWQERTPGEYVRAGELLTLEVARDRDMNVLNVSIVPVSR